MKRSALAFRNCKERSRIPANQKVLGIILDERFKLLESTHPAAATSIGLHDSNQPWRSTALPPRAVEHASPIRTSAAPPARQAPPHPRPVTPAASARATSNAPPLRDHERPPRTQRPHNRDRPQSRFVRAQSQCSSRASLPLTRQAGTPTATIGMRPATPLRN